jgi:DNA-binding phage protein
MQLQTVSVVESMAFHMESGPMPTVLKVHTYARRSICDKEVSLPACTQVINDILADGDQAELLIVLRQMAQAFGGVQAVAEQAHLNPPQLYRTLSPKGNLRWYRIESGF